MTLLREQLEAERKLFESCKELRHCDFTRPTDLQYSSSATRCAWLAWQARAAQSAPVPPSVQQTNCKHPDCTCAWVAGNGLVCEAAPSVQVPDIVPEALKLIENLMQYGDYDTEYDGRMYSICHDCGAQDGADHSDGCEFVKAKVFVEKHRAFMAQLKGQKS